MINCLISIFVGKKIYFLDVDNIYKINLLQTMSPTAQVPHTFARSFHTQLNPNLLEVDTLTRNKDPFVFSWHIVIATTYRTNPPHLSSGKHKTKFHKGK